MTDRYSAAPKPSHRLIPSRFPPIGLFDTVTTTADLAAVMELVGWTNDRLVAERIHRLPESERVYGVANASANFDYFRLDYGEGDAPVDWKNLVDHVTAPAACGVA